jgi:hypothetical protein
MAPPLPKIAVSLVLLGISIWDIFRHFPCHRYDYPSFFQQFPKKGTPSGFEALVQNCREKKFPSRQSIRSHAGGFAAFLMARIAHL